MRLALLYHLEAMLNRTQKNIGFAEVAAFLVADQLFATQQLQRLEGISLAQMNIFAGVDQLQGLHEKFDFADSAPAQLKVYLSFAGPGQIAVDLLLHGLDIFDHAVIEVPPVNKRRQGLDDPFTQFFRPGHRPGLEHGGALPALPPAFIINFRTSQGDGHFTAAPFRT